MLAIATYNHYKRVDHEERRKSRAKAAAAPAESAGQPPRQPLSSPLGEDRVALLQDVPSAHADIRPELQRECLPLAAAQGSVYAPHKAWLYTPGGTGSEAIVLQARTHCYLRGLLPESSRLASVSSMLQQRARGSGVHRVLWSLRALLSVTVA